MIPQGYSFCQIGKPILFITLNEIKALLLYNYIKRNIIKGLIMSESEYKYRFDFEANDLEQLQKLLNRVQELDKYDTLKELYSLNEMIELISKPKKIKKSAKKMVATDKATEARTARAKEKIQNAINILRMENKKITHYSIAKTAGVSYLTVKKYISLDEIN